MVNNLPLRTVQHADLTIEGYSRAAVQSYWRIPELKLGFDLGAQPWEFMGTETWFVSHAHLDHIAALPVYVARRRMMKMEPPDDLPAGARRRATCERLLQVIQRLDRGRLPCELRRRRAGRRDRTLARTGRHGLRHHAHGPVAGLRGVGPPQQAEGRIPGPHRRPDSRPAARRARR